MNRETELVKFGKKVRYPRRMRAISQEELAERCKLHRTYIGGIERGERNVALLNIVTIAHALDVSPCDLFEEVEEE
jgi:transcriptional regulator with XRE-family HTH domain